MGESAILARFRGTVSCVREAHGPLGLTLSGRTAEHPGEDLWLAFAAAAPADLPPRLEGAAIEHSAPGEYRIVSAERAWRVAARSVHLHREVADAFYRAIPPRRAPLLRRALFSVLPAIARSGAGLALLKALRR